jgi:hypothetical protein
LSGHTWAPTGKRKFAASFLAPAPEARPEVVELARQLRRPDPDRRPISLRKVAAALAGRGYVASTGKPYEAAAVASMLAIRKPVCSPRQRAGQSCSDAANGEAISPSR